MKHAIVALLALYAAGSITSPAFGQPKQEDRKGEAPQNRPQQPQHPEQHGAPNRPEPQRQQPAPQPPPQTHVQPQQQQQRNDQHSPPPQQTQRAQPPREQQRPPQAPAPQVDRQRQVQQQQNDRRGPDGRPQQQQAQRPSQPAPQYRQQPQQRGAPPQRSEQQARAWQQQKSWQRPGGWQGHADFRQDRARNWRVEHRTWAQRGGYGGYIIPQDRFSLSFGPQHYFRIGRLPVIYDGYPRFSYNGYSFLMLDPWPENWGSDWWDSDDVYVQYDADGYYLYDRNYPGEGIAVSIIL